MKTPCVYMMASGENGTLYVGVTSNLLLRVGRHKAKTYPGFTSDYNLNSLVWYELQDTMANAIRGEKQIKKYNRAWKKRLIYRSALKIRLFDPATYARTSGYGFEKPNSQLRSVLLPSSILNGGICPGNWSDWKKMVKKRFSRT